MAVDAHSAVGPAIDNSCLECRPEPFFKTLARHGLEIKRDRTDTLQINVGFYCNQVCRHCHLEAGPGRLEIMDLHTMNDVVAYAGRSGFQTVDITGGAPEMNPHIEYLIEDIAPLAGRIMLRSNLTALGNKQTDDLIKLCCRHRVVIVASLPSVKTSQTDSQRGKGVMDASIAMLRKLNNFGYGQAGTGLELNLVSSPSGAFLTASQAQSEKRFRDDLERKYGLVFNNLFTFANVPLGRFRSWLQESGNLDRYEQRLAESFNPCTIQGLMCRTLVSVSWDGYLFDCDFNLALRAYLGGLKKHVSEMEGAPEAETRIPIGDHCYACTAGAGFT